MRLDIIAGPSAHVTLRLLSLVTFYFFPEAAKISSVMRKRGRGMHRRRRRRRSTLLSLSFPATTVEYLRLSCHQRDAAGPAVGCRGALSRRHTDTSATQGLWGGLSALTPPPHPHSPVVPQPLALFVHAASSHTERLSGHEMQENCR